MDQSHQQYRQRHHQWHPIPGNEPDLDALLSAIDWGSTPIHEHTYQPHSVIDRQDRHDEFAQLFSVREARDDLDHEIFVEASDIWIKRLTVTTRQLPQLIWRRLHRSRQYGGLTETEVGVRLARLRIY